MKKTTVGSGGTQSDGFDLDSFLRENNFFTDDVDLNKTAGQQNISSQKETTPQQTEAPELQQFRRQRRFAQTEELWPQEAAPAGKEESAALRAVEPVGRQESTVPQEAAPANLQKATTSGDTTQLRSPLSQTKQKKSAQVEATQKQDALPATAQTIAAQVTTTQKATAQEVTAQEATAQTIATQVTTTQKATAQATAAPKTVDLKEITQKETLSKKPTKQGTSPAITETTEITLRDEVAPLQKEDIQKKTSTNNAQQIELFEEASPQNKTMQNKSLLTKTLQSKGLLGKSQQSKTPENQLPQKMYQQQEPVREELQTGEISREKRGAGKSMDQRQERVPTQNAREGIRRDIPASVSMSPSSKKAPDTDSTISYRSLGEEFPEIPLLSDNKQQADSFKSDDPDFDFLEKLTTDYTNEMGVVGKAGSSGARASGLDKKTRPDQPRSAANKDRAAATTVITDQDRTVLMQASQTTTKQSSSKQSKKAAQQASAKKEARLETFANPRDFQQARMQDNSYRIRGGGTRHNKRSPVMVIVIAVVIVIGMVIAGFFLKDLYDRLMGQKPTETVVRLTTAQTRAAIDAEMPIMFDYLYWNINDIYSHFVAAGWNVANNERRAVENPDRSAVGGEIIHLSPEIPLDILEGYYQSEFNIYDYDELQDNFNGAWVLSVSHGNMGSYTQIKYVNFASISLDDELLHLGEAQKLLTESSVIDARGIDGYGNSFMQGFIDINDKIYYWKIVGIEFSDYYRGQDRRKLPDTAVFVKCIIADFDFYGMNKELLESYLKQKEEAAGNPE